MRLFAILIALTFQLAALETSAVDHPPIEGMGPSEKVEILWAKFTGDNLDPVAFYALVSTFKSASLDQADLLRLKQMRSSFEGGKKSTEYYEDLSPKLALRLATESKLYKNIETRLGSKALKALEKAEARVNELRNFRPKSRDEVMDLVYEAPDLGAYQGGDYFGGVKLFLFCRKDRRFPCRFVMKNVFDRLVRNDDGSVWNMPALAKSAGDIPYHTTNGHTPAGLHSMDSVMPEADQQLSFGKFRRVILNWIPKDARVLELLPESAKDQKWWKQASLARDNGRKWLRVHGTGRINKNPQSAYYPHVPTAGCVSVREGEYGKFEYTDQRRLLDRIMRAMRIAPVYSNETRIKGMLYVVELDDRKRRVSKATLRKYGIR